MHGTPDRSRQRAVEECKDKASFMTDATINADSHLHEDGSIERLTIDTIRTLSMDAVQQANSGHPGTPMALAPVGHTVWSKFLRYDPAHADWPNRDLSLIHI